MQQASESTNKSLGYAVGATVLACILGLGAGAVMARFAPSDDFSWAGLVVAPLWFLLEVFFEITVGVLGYRTKATRVASTIAVLLGFYVAWFALRGVAP
jgi:hypothetical protein